VSSRSQVFLAYLDFFRSKVLDKVGGLPEGELRHSRLPSGWTPVELVKHLQFVELRWLEWGYEGRKVADAWGDNRDERWHVPASETLHELTSALEAQGHRSRAVVEAHDLSEVGRPGLRWDGADPPTLERILFHMLQEYARHLGHLDIVAELADGSVGE
jgi:uncharacterized damage-inducible protein DinB